MRRNRSRLALLGILALALSLTAGLALSDVAAAKKKKRKGGTVDITKTVAAPIPDGTASVSGTLSSTIEVAGRKLNGTRVRDVNVTVQATGATGTNPIADLGSQITAPNGETSWLTGTGLPGTLLGPLTLDDETANSLFPLLPPAPAPNNDYVIAPYQGTAQPYCFFALGACTLSVIDNAVVTGTWTLRFFDMAPDDTSVLNSWRLTILAGRPFKTK